MPAYVQAVMTVIGWILMPTCSALIVGLLNYRKALRKERERSQAKEDKFRRLVTEGMKTLCRRELVDAYRDHVTNGVPLTVERFHEITNTWNTYSGLGGNGTGEQMYKGICEKQMHIVR